MPKTSEKARPLSARGQNTAAPRSGAKRSVASARTLKTGPERASSQSTRSRPLPGRKRLAAPTAPRPKERSAKRAQTAAGSKARPTKRPPRLTETEIRAAALELGFTLSASEVRALSRSLSGLGTLLIGSAKSRDLAIFASAARLLDQPVLLVTPYSAALLEMASALNGAPSIMGFSSADDERAQKVALARIARGGSLLVVIEPTELFSEPLRAAALHARLGLVGVAAAHAVGSDAHELRPAYLRLSTTLQAIGAAPLLGTCTLTRAAARVADGLGIVEAGLIAAEPTPFSLTLEAVRGPERKSALLRALTAAEGAGIVFAATPQEVDAAFVDLRAHGLSVLRLHQGMAAHERAAALTRFRTKGLTVALVTVSPHASLAGLASLADADLGLASPPRNDLRFVIHLQAPLSLEQHFEDTAWLAPGGRAVAFVEPSDAALANVMLAQQRVKPLAVESVADAVASAGPERPASLEAIALGAGLSRRLVERVVAALADRKLVVRDGNVIRASCLREELVAEARLIAAAFAGLRAGDAERARAVAKFLTSGASASHEIVTAPNVESPGRRAQG